MKVFLPNLGFEDDLAGRPLRPTVETAAAVAELGINMSLLANPGDAVAIPDGFVPDDLPPFLRDIEFIRESQVQDSGSVTLVPWGWSPSTLQLAIACDMPPEHVPKSSVVRYVNSRLFSAQFDVIDVPQECTSPFEVFPFGTLCRDLEQWRQAVTMFRQLGYMKWVAKPQVSHAGRNRLIASGDNLNSQQRGWLNRNLRHPDGVYLEPWVEPLEEAGLQFEILASNSDEAATTRLLGVTGLINDPVGRYQGSVVYAAGHGVERWSRAIAHGHEVCRAAAAAGYQGPLGIDCFRFADPSGNHLVTRLCNDVNARFTMGRVALPLRRFLNSEPFGIWLHLTGRRQKSDTDVETTAITHNATDVKIIRTSPTTVSGSSVRAQTLFMTGPDAKKMVQLLTGQEVSGLTDGAAF